MPEAHAAPASSATIPPIAPSTAKIMVEFAGRFFDVWGDASCSLSPSSAPSFVFASSLTSAEAFGSERICSRTRVAFRLGVVQQRQIVVLSEHFVAVGVVDADLQRHGCAL